MPTTPKLFLALSGALAIAAPIAAPAAILLNEIHFRTPASSDTVPNDKNYEFVELRSTTNGVEECTNMWVLIIDNEGGNVGEIKEAWPLKDANNNWLKTGANGLLLLGDDYLKTDSPWVSFKSPQTTMGDPSGMVRMICRMPMPLVFSWSPITPTRHRLVPSPSRTLIWTTTAQVSLLAGSDPPRRPLLYYFVVHRGGFRGFQWRPGRSDQDRFQRHWGKPIRLECRQRRASGHSTGDNVLSAYNGPGCG